MCKPKVRTLLAHIYLSAISGLCQEVFYKGSHFRSRFFLMILAREAEEQIFLDVTLQ